SELCPPRAFDGPKYIARSTTTGCVAITCVANAMLGTIWLAHTFSRENGAMLYTRLTMPPPSSIKFTVACAAVLPGFAIRTHVSEPPPVNPSARYQLIAGCVTPLE